MALRKKVGSIHSKPRANTVSDMSMARESDATPMSAMLVRKGFNTSVNGTEVEQHVREWMRNAVHVLGAMWCGVVRWDVV